MLKVGQQAPLFSLPDQSGKLIRLSDYLDKKIVVLFFYPKDGTPGCTAQSCSFRDRSGEFAALGAQILGVSQDDASSHQQFKTKYSLQYPLLSDVLGTVASQFGVSKTFGLIAGRVTFVIDAEGIIQSAFSSQLQIQKHIELALDTVRTIHSQTTQPETPA